MVRCDGIVKVLDFSLANLAEQPAVNADTYVGDIIFLLILFTFRARKRA